MERAKGWLKKIDSQIDIASHICMMSQQATQAHRANLRFLLSFAKPQSIDQCFVLAARYAQIGQLVN